VNADLPTHPGMKIGDVLSFAPFLAASVAIPGIVVYRQLLGHSGVAPSNINWIMGLVPLCFAVFVTLANAHLSFSRPWLHSLKNKSMDSYRFVSGIPVMGSIAILVSSLWSPPSFWIGVAMLVTYILDTGGLFVFAITVVVEQFIRGERDTG
jgi:hypothetical protein